MYGILERETSSQVAVTKLCSFRVNGILATSRTIGDGSMKVKAYITAEPEITHRDIQPGDEYVILATDGLWDVLSNQQV